MLVQLLRSLIYFRSSLKASKLLIYVLRQKGHPPWTAFYVRQWDVLDDLWGKSCFNFEVDKVNYQILRTACFPLIKYHCTRCGPVELKHVDRFYLFLKIVNLGVPTLIYGVAGLFLARRWELIHTPSGYVRIYMWYKENKGSQY
ncbi:hypothetical protein FBUS_00143 [Fasciolopsis buskii]|uniref:Uncharacterized protein n=1 Tax=Fasciolopsis buskii TaxID=27845 RepID=A0A8E0S333_9TREM|nr:hypothetical protein FBUS_00143 [Fasciolopsis buski]